MCPPTASLMSHLSSDAYTRPLRRRTRRHSHKGTIGQRLLCSSRSFMLIQNQRMAYLHLHKVRVRNATTRSTTRKYNSQTSLGPKGPNVALRESWSKMRRRVLVGRFQYDTRGTWEVQRRNFIRQRMQRNVVHGTT